MSGTMSHTLRAMTSGSQQVFGLLPNVICFQADQFRTICFECTCITVCWHCASFVDVCSVQGDEPYLTHSEDYSLDTSFYDLCLDMIAAIGEPYGASATVRTKIVKSLFALLLMKKVVVRRFHIPRLYRQNNVLVHFNFSVLEEVIMCELFLDRHECSMGEWARSATHQMANGRLAS